MLVAIATFLHIVIFISIGVLLTIISEALFVLFRVDSDGDVRKEVAYRFQPLPLRIFNSIVFGPVWWVNSAKMFMLSKEWLIKSRHVMELRIINLNKGVIIDTSVVTY